MPVFDKLSICVDFLCIVVVSYVCCKVFDCDITYTSVVSVRLASVQCVHFLIVMVYECQDDFVRNYAVQDMLTACQLIKLLMSHVQRSISNKLNSIHC